MLYYMVIEYVLYFLLLLIFVVLKISWFFSNKIFTVDKKVEYENICEHNYNITDQPSYYVITSGTTSNAKYIPIYLNKKISYPLSPVMPLLRTNILKHICFGKVAFFFKNSAIYETKNGIEISNGITRQIKAILDTKIGYKLIKKASISPFKTYTNLDTKYEFMKMHILYALLDRDLTMMCGYFTRSILEKFDMILDNFEYYIEMIKKINTKMNTKKISELDEKINERITELTIIYNCNIKNNKDTKDAKKGIIKKIWKKLSLIVCGNSGVFEIYIPRIKYYTDNVTIYSPFYACTEMIIGLNLGNINDNKYSIDNRLGIIHETTKTKSLMYENKYLRLMVTTKNGLTDYLIDDMLQFCGDDNGTFYFEGRFSFYNNIGLTERSFVSILTSQLKHHIRDFIIIDHLTYFELVIELYDVIIYDETVLIDAINGNSNGDGKNKKITKIKNIKYGSFDKFVDNLDKNIQNKYIDSVKPDREQLKIPRIVDNTYFMNYFDDFCNIV